MEIIDGKDRLGGEVDSEDGLDGNGDDAVDDEEDYGDEQDFEAEGVKARTLDFKSKGKGVGKQNEDG